ncbi:MAG: DNA cytosine methyltransferase [Muribaculaceae bacterium]|nr:DNA cytosine methyltransferase [Muribaculaceae bacterium]
MNISTKIPFPSPTISKFKFIDLFAGIGGFRLALQQLGGECVFSSEWDSQAKETYQLNYGELPYGDITLKQTQDSIPNGFDILCGGFPCQPFSICGKKLGFEDTRGTLFFEICQILEKYKPQICLLENVQHLTKHDNGNTFKVILKSLNNLGYNISYKILNAKDFGLPQFRERIFIVGSRKGIFDFNKIKLRKSVKLEDFLDYDSNYDYLDESEYTLLSKDLVKVQPKSGLIFCGYRNKGIWKKGIRPNSLHLSRCHRQPNRIYSIKGTHPTIPSQETNGRFFIYNPDKNRVRKLSINECYKIMGYPKEFLKHPNLASQYKQIGNSVAIPVIKAIGDAIIEQNLLIPEKLKEYDFGFNSSQLIINF